jgi:hypothetical protein
MSQPAGGGISGITVGPRISPGARGAVRVELANTVRPERPALGDCGRLVDLTTAFSTDDGFLLGAPPS